MKPVNALTTATFYSLVGSKGAVLLVAKWMSDWPTEATCWVEIDREPIRDDEPVWHAWDRLKNRARHLLPLAVERRINRT